MNLQVRYELEVQKDKSGNRLEREVVVRERTMDYVSLKDKALIKGVEGARAGRVRSSHRIRKGVNKKEK